MENNSEQNATVNSELETSVTEEITEEVIAEEIAHKEQDAAPDEPETPDTEETTAPKASFFKTHLKKIIIIGGAVILAVIIAFATLLVLNGSKAANIEEQLKGMTFEYYDEYSVGVSGLKNWNLETFTFKEDGTYLTESWDHYPTDAVGKRLEYSEDTRELEVNVTLGGDISFGANDMYKIILNDNDEIEAIVYNGSSFENRYEPVDSSSAKEKLGKSAVRIFSNLKVPNKPYNFEKLVTTVYKDYDVYYYHVENSDKYLITVKGPYYLNKAGGNFTQEGTLTVEVDLNSDEYEIISDNGVISAMEVYYYLTLF